MNYENIDYQELSQMKQQLGLLHAKLDRQMLVNDKMMRQAMRNKYNWIDRKSYIFILVALLGIPYFLFLNQWLQMPLPLVAYTVFYFLACTAAIIGSRQILNSGHFTAESMKEIGQRIVRLKRYDRTWKCIGYPMVAVWLIWFLSFLTIDNGEFHPNSMFYGGLVGLVIGLVCGAIYTINYNKTINSLQDQINEIENT